MKKIFSLLTLASAVFLGACSSTTITEYDSLGNPIKTTTSKDNAFVLLANGLEKKDNFIHVSGWCVGVNPISNIYGVGACDFVAGSINSNNGATNAVGYSTMIDSSKVSLDITANKDGITAKATSNETSVQTPKAEKE